MAISLISASPIITGINVPLTPVAGTYQTGDALIFITGEHQGTDNLSAPAGWQLLSPNATVTTLQIYGRIAQSTSETIPSVNWGSVNRGWAMVSAFRGVDPSFTSLMPGTAERLTNTTANMAGSAANKTPTSDNALVIFAGQRNKLTASDGSVFTKPTGAWDGMLAQLVQPGSTNSMSAAISYWIQTTATVMPLNSIMAGTGIDGVTQAAASTTIFLAPAPSGGGGGGGTGTPSFPPPKRKIYVFYDNYYPR